MELIEIKDFKLSFLFKSLKKQTTVENTVQKIIREVKSKGDKALLAYTKQFDKVELKNLKVPISTIIKKKEQLNPQVTKIFLTAIKNIKKFHSYNLPKTWLKKDKDRTILGKIISPLDRVGCYIPGGNAAYPSTLLMNVIPAQVAGVPSIAVVTPANKTGLPSDYILACCGLLNLKEVYAVGGAQAIAALAFGTKTIKAVCKITGPGNQYVAEAKRQVFGKVGIDSIAGPSEIVILADDLSVPIEFIARDLLAQAEHDTEAKAILITPSKIIAKKTQKAVLNLLPKASPITQRSIANYGKIVLANNLEKAIELVNKIAPEHLEILVKKPEKVVLKIRNAGAIFVGAFSCETVGDYFAGPNHTIPTNGAAIYSSPLSTQDFLKHSSYINYSLSRFKNQASAITQFANLEKLPAHAAAITCRLNQNSKVKI